MTGPLHVLIVEDEDLVAAALARFVEQAGHRVKRASNGAEALATLSADRFDLVLSDLGLPGDLEGIDLIRAMARPDGPPVVVVTGRSDLANAVEALQAGASDYLEKPLTAELVQRTLRRVILDQVRPSNEVRAWEQAVLRSTRSPRMREVIDHVARCAKTRAHVLVMGESGTGKGVIARYLHDHSARSSGPFVRVHAASLGAGADDVLFGAPGREASGLLLDADGGTLFVDTLDEIAPEAQPKLLRMLETSRVYRGGDTESTAVDVRIVATTSLETERALLAEGLRADFYYRIAEDVIRVPPLRTRVEDIVPLAEHFLGRVCAPTGRTMTLTPDAGLTLVGHGWPGNLRELRHVVERSVLLAKGDRLDADDLARAGVPGLGG